MPSATDIITYVGVPLTVAGVIPLLWNMFKAFLIRYKLSRSIPWQFRHLYNLIADPAAGTVTVVARTPHLSFPGLWRGAEPPQLPSRGSRFRRQYHRVAYTLIDGSKTLLVPFIFVYAFCVNVLSKKEKGVYRPRFPKISTTKNFLALQSSVKTQPVSTLLTARRPFHLHKPWMDLSLQLAFDLSANSEEYSFILEEDGEVRVLVDIDMGISKQMPLAMDFTQWVLLALGMGACPYDGCLQQMSSGPILNSKGNILLRKRFSDERYSVKLEIRNATLYSLRRSFAYEGLMILGRNNSELCMALGGERRFPLKTVEIDTENYFSTLLWATDADEEGVLHPKFLRGSRITDSSKALAAALTWLFYHHECLQNGENLPIPEWVVEVQQRSLLFLQDLDMEGSLEPHVYSLFPSQSSNNEPPSTQDEKSQTDAQASPTADIIYVPSPAKMSLRGRRATQPDSANPPNVAKKILDTLRHAFSESAFVSRSRKAQKELIDFATYFGQHGTHKFRVMSMLPERKDLLVRSVKAFGDLTSSTLDPSPRYKRASTIDLNPLVPFENVAKLKSSLDPHVAMNNPSKLTLETEPEETTILAHILLGLADWNGYQARSWPMDETLTSCVLRIKESVESLVNDKPGHSNLPKGLVEDLELATTIAKRGIYTAPDFSLRDLIPKHAGTVYIL